MKKELGYIEIFKKFNEERIKYIVCGGVAVNLLGIPRMTYDIDLLIKMEEKNLRKLLSLLKRLGFKPKAPVNIMELCCESKRKEWIRNKNMKAFNLYNTNWAISEIDILIESPVSYKEAIKRALYKRVEGVRIPVISGPDLIKMKQNSPRKQDKADVRYLRKIL